MVHWLVVGGGTAGCVVAARLSDVAGNRVTLVEAGGGDGRRLTGASSLADLAVTGAVWEPLRPYLQGRGLGGSSRVNGALLSGVGVDLLPAEVVGEAELGAVDRALLGAAADAEPAVLVRRDGRLLSAADIFLAPVLGRANLTVITETAVRSVRLERRRAIGAMLADGAAIDADAVVVCAGAVHSPSILARSGIRGPGLGEVVDHPSRVVDLALRPVAAAPPESLVTGAVLRRGDVEIVALNHVGAAAPGAGALLVGALGHRRRGRVEIGSGNDASVVFDPLGADDAAALDDAVAAAVGLLGRPSFGEIVERWSVSADVGGYFHAAGSCRSVVDADGAVVGHDQLYVADSSIIDLPPSGLVAPTIAVASRVAATLVSA